MRGAAQGTLDKGDANQARGVCSPGHDRFAHFARCRAPAAPCSTSGIFVFLYLLCHPLPLLWSTESFVVISIGTGKIKTAQSYAETHARADSGISQEERKGGSVKNLKQEEGCSGLEGVCAQINCIISIGCHVRQRKGGRAGDGKSNPSSLLEEGRRGAEGRRESPFAFACMSAFWCRRIKSWTI